MVAIIVLQVVTVVLLAVIIMLLLYVMQQDTSSDNTAETILPDTNKDVKEESKKEDYPQGVFSLVDGILDGKVDMNSEDNQ